MMKFSPVSLLFASLVALVVACSPNSMLAQHHGKGSHGSGSHGRSHSGGSHSSGHGHASGGKIHGGGNSHGGGFHGSSRGSGSRGRGRSHASRGGGSFLGGRSQGSGSGHFSARSSRSSAPVGPSERVGGSHGTALAPNHLAHPPSSRGSGAHGPTAGDGQWHSFTNRGNFSVTRARGPSSPVGDGQWHSFENRGNSSVTAGRGPTSTWQGGAAKSWNGQRHQTSPNSFGSPAFEHSAAPRRASNPTTTASNRRFAELPRRTTGSAISANRVVSNIDHSRFGNSATDRISFSNSRFGSHVPRFERPEFGERHEFRSSESRFGFGRESSYGGDAFSFFPDLLGLALAFGSFGARGFGLPGLALNLLESGFGDFANGSGYGGGYGGNSSYDDSAGYDAYGGCISTPGAVSSYSGLGVIPYPADNLTCPQ
jgi:hypothetical protein